MKKDSRFVELDGSYPAVYVKYDNKAHKHMSHF